MRKLNWKKAIFLPVLFPFAVFRGYKINRLLDEAQDALSADQSEKALTAARLAVEASNDRVYAARIFEGVALAQFRQHIDAGTAFNRAVELIEQDSSLDEKNRNYLKIYCYSYFKSVDWPATLVKPRHFPDLPSYSEVEQNIVRTFPLT